MEQTEKPNAKASGFPKGQPVPKVSTYNREKYEANKEKILAYRKKRYRELNAYKYDIQINQGLFIISFD
jgi:hypothetical protein